MANEVMNWDDAYREQAVFGGSPPWNIGEPQPELAALAAEGYTVVGVDLTPTAIATRSARRSSTPHSARPP